MGNRTYVILAAALVLLGPAAVVCAGPVLAPVSQTGTLAGAAPEKAQIAGLSRGDVAVASTWLVSEPGMLAVIAAGAVATVIVRRRHARAVRSA